MTPSGQQHAQDGQVATERHAEEGQQPGGDGREGDEAGEHAVAELDPRVRVELGHQAPVGVALRPVRAAQARSGDAHRGAGEDDDRQRDQRDGGHHEVALRGDADPLAHGPSQDDRWIACLPHAPAITGRAGAATARAAAPIPGRCASCCRRARLRRWPRGRWRCAATPRPSSMPPRCTWRWSCRRSGAAAAATPRSPTSLRGLEAGGHRASIWVLDDEGRHAAESPAETAATLRGVLRAPRGARARRVRGLGGRRRGDGHRLADRGEGPAAAGRERPRLPRAGPRARVLPTSSERQWAAWTYRQGLHCIAASPWLADLVHTRYGASATSFDLGIDHERYRPAAGRAGAATRSCSMRGP